MAGLSRREQAVAAFQVMDVVALAQQMAAAGADVIHLEVGEPDWPLPNAVLNAVQAALQTGATRYSSAQGIDGLQSALAAWYQRHFQLNIDPARFILTPGASGALQIALALTLDVQDTLLTPVPGYPCNGHIAKILGADVQSLVLSEASGWTLSADDLARLEPPYPRAFLLASPNNPTGAVLTPMQLQAVVDWCMQHQVTLLVDEIYQGLVHQTPQFSSVLAHQPEAWVISSFSKYFALTGWRLGWVIVPPNAIDAANRLVQNLFLAAPTLAQHAAHRALQPDMDAEFRSRAQGLKQRRDILYDGLRALHLPVPGGAEGAFYVFADVRSTGLSAAEFCRQLLHEAQVAATPGDDFAGPQASHYVRFAYTASPERLQEALQRIRHFLQARITL